MRLRVCVRCGEALRSRSPLSCCRVFRRRFLCVVLEDMRVLERCSLSKLAAHPKARLFRQLLEMFRFYIVSQVASSVVLLWWLSLLLLTVLLTVPLTARCRASSSFGCWRRWRCLVITWTTKPRGAGTAPLPKRHQTARFAVWAA